MRCQTGFAGSIPCIVNRERYSSTQIPHLLVPHGNPTGGSQALTRIFPQQATLQPINSHIPRTQPPPRLVTPDHSNRPTAQDQQPRPQLQRPRDAGSRDTCMEREHLLSQQRADCTKMGSAWSSSSLHHVEQGQHGSNSRRISKPVPQVRSVR